MANKQMREKAKIKKGEDKSGMVSFVFIHPVSPAVREKSRDDVYSKSKCLSDIASLFLTS
jgi:hypothetical protein